jgi:DNA-binding CsgD family transcriptional regulator
MAFLQEFFRAIAQAKTEQDLRLLIATEIREYFTATRGGLFFFDQLPLADSKLQKVLEIALSTQHNPVLHYLVEHHAPVHEALLVTPKTWQLICPRADHWHVMAGPIVSNGKLVGTIGFTRKRDLPAFEHNNLADLSAICLHLSTWAATVCSQHQLVTNQLTPREVQIAQLVAQGKTNAAIGKELWITENSVKQALKRMFRKLKVSSRAEMVAQLSINSKMFLTNLKT